MQLLVTVGTTQFDQLIRELDCPEFYDQCLRKGIRRVVLQFGRGVYEPRGDSRLDCEIMRYSTEMGRLIQDSQVVICHSGAGTLLQCLTAQKRIVTVLNESLQDNHQEELWEEVGRLPGVTAARVPDFLQSWSQAEIGSGAMPLVFKGGAILKQMYDELFP